MLCSPPVWVVFKLSCREEENCDRHNLTTCSLARIDYDCDYNFKVLMIFFICRRDKCRKEVKKIFRFVTSPS